MYFHLRMLTTSTPTFCHQCGHSFLRSEWHHHHHFFILRTHVLVDSHHVQKVTCVCTYALHVHMYSICQHVKLKQFTLQFTLHIYIICISLFFILTVYSIYIHVCSTYMHIKFNCYFGYKTYYMQYYYLRYMYIQDTCTRCYCTVTMCIV